MRQYSKKDIKNMAIVESKLCRVFEKKDLKLREETSNSYVEPSKANASTSSLASDLSKAQVNNPHDEEFVVDVSSYDGSQSSQDVTLDIKANNPQDASNKLQAQMKDPSVSSLVRKGNLKAKVHMGENIVTLSKSELNKLLFN